MRLYEKKDHLINRNRNLTSEQKSEIIELLGRHPSYENKIDWNKSNSLTYEDFLEVLRPLYINELDPRGLVEGQDYDILYESEGEALYFVYTYEASVILASNSVGPEMWTEIPDWCGREEFTDEAHAFGHFDPEHGNMKPGAKWCISMQTSDKYWKQYSEDFFFFFWFRNKKSIKEPNRKIAIVLNKYKDEISMKYNGEDENYNPNLPSDIQQKVIVNSKEFIRDNLLKDFTFNPETRRYDYDNYLTRYDLKYFVAENKDGFTINFGEVTGDFNCIDLGLKSLKGAPQKVGKNFFCQRNQLSSLEGAPQKVGGFFGCRNNKLTSLEGAPKEVGEDFDCSDNQLTSLEGAPQKVGGFFDCSSNKLTSLKGSPEKIIEYFDCSCNYLTSLEGAPKEVDRSFICSKNQLTSLKGAPQKIGWSLDCSVNKLTSLEGAPNYVGGDFICYNNYLRSLEGVPKEIIRNLDCRRNISLNSLKGIGTVKGTVYKDF